MFGEDVYKIGCDVGSKGAFAILNVHTEELHFVDMPREVHKIAKPTGRAQNKSVYHPDDFLNLFRPYTFKATMLKEVQNVFVGKDNAWQVSQQIRCDAMIITAAAACMVKVEEVDPKTWKACIMRGRGGVNATKPACVKMARTLFPAAAEQIAGHDEAYGRADAALLLYYLLLGPKIHDTRAVFQPVRCRVVADGQSQMRLSL